MNTRALTPRGLQDCVLLLVDDEPVNLDLLEEFLGNDGYGGMLRAQNAFEAVRLFEQHAPDIVLLDLHMPRHDGFDLLRAVQQRTAPGDFLPVLVLTADASPAARMRALSEGAHDFLTKPLDALEVSLRVRILLRTRLLHHEQRRAMYVREHVLSVVAHDLRNPLASIAMDAEMLRHLTGDDEPVQLKTVQRIERTAASMQRLIDDLLEVSRIQYGMFAIRAAHAAPAAVFAEAEALLSGLARSRGIRLSFDGPKELPLVRVDSERIVQVFSNLIGNALKFTPAAGTVRVSWQARDTEVVVSVADTGPGISEAQLAHVFSPFWQAHERERRRGLGLGLVITRGIVESHGGRIWIESTVGRGTTVHFTIPFAATARQADRKSAVEVSASPQVPASPGVTA